MNIVKTLNYDCTLCTALNANHGVSGHLYEVIEYFYYLRFMHNVNTCIVIPYEFSKEEFLKALKSKYVFTDEEIEIYLNNIIINNNIKVLISNTVIFTDGSIFNCPDNAIQQMQRAYTVIAKNKIFIRCNNPETLDKADIVLQDTRLYNDCKNSVHYIKKILFDKLKKPTSNCPNTAMLYLTSNCRYLKYDELVNLKNKYNKYKFIVLSNKADYKIPEGFKLYEVPCQNMFDKFDTYIYTHLSGTCGNDCSPRFVPECYYFNKKVIFDIGEMYPGLKVRVHDIETKGIESLHLTKDDPLINYI